MKTDTEQVFAFRRMKYRNKLINVEFASLINFEKFFEFL
jgi:hypothetical protein